MPFEAVERLAELEAIEAARRRREEQVRFAERVEDQDVSPHRLRQEARRFESPLPTLPERMDALLADLGPTGRESSDAASAELATNPRGRLARLQGERAALAGEDVSRETSPMPIFTDAPRAQPRDDVGTMPYRGALEGLQGAEVPRAGIRQEFGGTAPDTVLSFSDAQGRQPGMRPYSAPSGRTRDVGAPGGSLGAISGGGGPGDRVREALLADMDALIAEAGAVPATPQEFAADLVREQPLWDVQAAAEGPEGVRMAILTAVAEGTLDPKVATTLQRRYEGIAESVADDGYVDPALFAERLGEGRPPAPGEAEARATSPGPLPAAAERERQAVTAALEPIPGGPGERQSPALAAETEPAGAEEPDSRDALLRGLQAPSQVETGGRGESGIEGLLADYEAFRGGEGRAGYGEPGMAGLMKDLIAFYGPRLPQDIVEALLGRGLVRGGQRLGGELLQSRAVQNALGRF